MFIQRSLLSILFLYSSNKINVPFPLLASVFHHLLPVNEDGEEHSIKKSPAVQCIGEFIQRMSS